MVKISIQRFSSLADPFFMVAISEERRNHLIEKMQATPSEIALAESMDPADGTYTEWVLKNIRKGTILEEDKAKIHSLLDKFKRLKNSPAFKENHSADINRYDPSTLFMALEKFGDSKKQDVKDLKSKGREGAQIVFQEDKWAVYKVSSAREAVILGSGTNWCTTQQGTAQGYLNDGPLWIFYKDGAPYAQLHIESNQFMNRVDKEFRKGRTVKDQGLYDVMEKIPDPAMEKFVGKLIPLVHPSERYLQILKKKSPEVLASGLRSLMIDRYPILEPEIFSLNLGEDYISTYLSYFDRRDPAVESAIVNKPAWASVYALYILKSRWMEAEELILKNQTKISTCGLYAVTFSSLKITSLSSLAKVLPKVKSKNDQIEEFLLSFVPNSKQYDTYISLSVEYMSRSGSILESLIDKFVSADYIKVAKFEEYYDCYDELAKFLYRKKIVKDGLVDLFQDTKFLQIIEHNDSYISTEATQYMIFAKGPNWFPAKSAWDCYSFESFDPNLHLEKILEMAKNRGSENLIRISKINPDILDKYRDQIISLAESIDYNADFYIKQDFFDPSILVNQHSKSKRIYFDEYTFLHGDGLAYTIKHLIPYLYSGKLEFEDDFSSIDLLKAMDISKFKNKNNLRSVYDFLTSSYEDMSFPQEPIKKAIEQMTKRELPDGWFDYDWMQILMDLGLRWPSYEKEAKRNPPGNSRTSIQKKTRATYKEFLNYIGA